MYPFIPPHEPPALVEVVAEKPPAPNADVDRASKKIKFATGIEKLQASSSSYRKNSSDKLQLARKEQSQSKPKISEIKAGVAAAPAKRGAAALAVPEGSVLPDKSGARDRPIGLESIPFHSDESSLIEWSGFSSTSLITQERGGEQRRLELSIPSGEAENGSDSPERKEQRTPATIERVNVVEVIADRQNYNEQQQVVTAEGNVVMRFGQALLTADRLQVNLNDRFAVAQGNVVLTRGEQVLRGDKFEYYLVQDRGSVFNARGEVYQTTLSRDISPARLPEDPTISDRALSDRLTNNQPLTNITADSGVSVVVGSTRDQSIVDRSVNVPTTATGGTVNRLRFEADRINFEADTWQATDFRLTNDPFSPPELEIRADRANFQQISPLVSELTTSNSRLVLDRRFSFPLLTNRLVFDNRPRRPGIVQFAYDGEERGGLYVERSFKLVNTSGFNWEVTPQYYLEKAIFEDGGIVEPSDFGLISLLNATFSPRTGLEARASLTSLDLGDLDNNLRAQVALRQQIGDLARPYTLSLGYNYRERLFNGSLGFQTVQSSIGAVLTSPNIPLGDTGINLSYQGSVQNIDADTDQADLLEPNRENNLVNLTRYQAAAFLSKGFPLWSGKPLPLTPDKGLRYTPAPVVPFLQLTAGISGVTSYYSNGDTQPSLQGTIGIQGQIGHFSRPFLDYTGFNVAYSQGIRGDQSPFLFDRFVDERTLSLGITQQIYGPIRIGFQTSVNLDSGETISTDYIIEYSRRTHNITLRYNPELEIGSIGLRISDFNWRGNPEPFDSTGVTPVVQGVSR
jgi:hypothetical protein